MKRINSYTLVELIVVLLIGSILTIAVWEGYWFISKEYSKWDKKNNHLRQIAIMDNQIREDIQRAFSIIKKNEGIELSIKGESIRYEFEDDFLVRHSSGSKDTLYLNILDQHFKFIESRKKSSSIVSSFSINVELANDQVNLFYFKEYDPLQLYYFQ